MYGQSACSTSISKVLIKCLAQVFAAAIRTQDFDRGAVILGACPGLKLSVDRQGIALRHEEVGESETHGVISEGNKIVLITLSRNWGWSPKTLVWISSPNCLACTLTRSLRTGCRVVCANKPTSQCSSCEFGSSAIPVTSPSSTSLCTLVGAMFPILRCSSMTLTTSTAYPPSPSCEMR